MKKDLTISLSHIVWVIGVIFMAGIAYSNITYLDHEITILEQRLEKKIKVINSCEDRIVELEIQLAKLQSCND